MRRNFSRSASSLLAVTAILPLLTGCAPRETARTDSVDSVAAATAATPSVASPAPTASESTAASGTSAAPAAAKGTSTSTRTAPEDTGRIIGRDSARAIDVRDPKRRLPVVPPSSQR